MVCTLRLVNSGGEDEELGQISAMKTVLAFNLHSPIQQNVTPVF